jgi:hypothetical protein
MVSLKFTFVFLAGDLPTKEKNDVEKMVLKGMTWIEGTKARRYCIVKKCEKVCEIELTAESNAHAHTKLQHLRL